MGLTPLPHTCDWQFKLGARVLSPLPGLDILLGTEPSAHALGYCLAALRASCHGFRTRSSGGTEVVGRRRLRAATRRTAIEGWSGAEPWDPRHDTPPQRGGRERRLSGDRQRSWRRVRAPTQGADHWERTAPGFHRLSRWGKRVVTGTQAASPGYWSNRRRPWVIPTVSVRWPGITDQA